MKQSNRSVLDFVLSVVMGTLVSVLGVISMYWDKITHSTKFLKSSEKFNPLDVYHPSELIDFYKDRRKAIRTIIGIVLIIIGIIILGYAEIIYHH